MEVCCIYTFENSIKPIKHCLKERNEGGRNGNIMGGG
jgi:hypothetical protein